MNPQEGLTAVMVRKVVVTVDTSPFNRNQIKGTEHVCKDKHDPDTYIFTVPTILYLPMNKANYTYGIVGVQSIGYIPFYRLYGILFVGDCCKSPVSSTVVHSVQEGEVLATRYQRILFSSGWYLANKQGQGYIYKGMTIYNRLPQ